MTLLYIEQYGGLFEVRVTSTAALNSWQGRVLLPLDLNIQSVSYGAGIGDVWQTPPAYAAHAIDFAGGTTAAFTGDGLLFRFTAVPPVASPQLIRFDVAHTALYAADGKGTVIAAQMRPLTINAKDLATVSSSAREADANAIPEPFTITKTQDSQIFDGKPVIIFSTTDAGSGIDHYEVEEYTIRGIIGWHTAVSPYLVDPDTTTILVKAVDRVGNVRTERIDLPRPGDLQVRVAVFAGLALLVGVVIVYFIYQWRKKS